MRKTISMTLLAALLLPLLTGCTAGAEHYTGEAQGYGGTLKVSVTVNGEDVTQVKVVEHHETQGVGTRAIDRLPKLIEEADHIGVDSVSGATVTSEAIKAAVSQALSQAGVIQQVIPLDGENAKEAASSRGMMGAGMASTGRVGPGKDADGKQVYSFNVVFAAGEFDQDGVIRAIKVDQLEVVTPNLGGGSAFAGFPTATDGEAAFLSQVEGWQSKGAMGDQYMLTSGSWREQMNAYEQMMVGKTVAEVMEWYAGREGSAESPENAPADGAAPTEGAAMSDDAAPTAAMDAASSATMSLDGEYGNILLAIQRAWEDAQRNGGSGTGKLVDTNIMNDGMSDETGMG